MTYSNFRFPDFPGSISTHEKYDLNDLQALPKLVKWAQLDSQGENGTLHPRFIDERYMIKYY